MKVSIIIPIFNEEKTLEKIFDRVKNQKLEKIEKEIILINDGSTDSSQKIIEKMAKEYPYQAKGFSFLRNYGKGNAVRKGLELSSGDIVIIQDADLEYDPKYYPALFEPIIKKQTQVVYGSRLKTLKFRLWGEGKTPLPLHYIANRFLSFMTNLFFSSNLTDMETGYKVFTRQVAGNLNLRAKRFDFEPEITAQILKAGYKIYEVPIKTKPRTYREGKKITWRDAFMAVRTLLDYRLQGKKNDTTS